MLNELRQNGWNQNKSNEKRLQKRDILLTPQICKCLSALKDWKYIIWWGIPTQVMALQCKNKSRMPTKSLSWVPRLQSQYMSVLLQKWSWGDLHFIFSSIPFDVVSPSTFLALQVKIPECDRRIFWITRVWLEMIRPEEMSCASTFPWKGKIMGKVFENEIYLCL